MSVTALSVGGHDMPRCCAAAAAAGGRCGQAGSEGGGGWSQRRERCEHCSAGPPDRHNSNK